MCNYFRCCCFCCLTVHLIPCAAGTNEQDGGNSCSSVFPLLFFLPPFTVGLLVFFFFVGFSLCFFLWAFFVHKLFFLAFRFVPFPSLPFRFFLFSVVESDHKKTIVTSSTAKKRDTIYTPQQQQQLLSLRQWVAIIIVRDRREEK